MKVKVTLTDYSFIVENVLSIHYIDNRYIFVINDGEIITREFSTFAEITILRSESNVEWSNHNQQHWY